jgi:hypothetical protein
LTCEHLETKTTSVDVPFKSVDVIVDIAAKVALHNDPIGASIINLAVTKVTLFRLKQQR